MRDTTTICGACLLLGLLASSAGAAEPVPEALRGFDQYVQRTEHRIRSEVTDKAFLWVDGLPATRRTQVFEQLRRGEVVIERIESGPAGRTISTPGAMIHHWTGTVLILSVTLAQVLRTIQDYDHHQEYFSPEVVRSRLLRHDGDEFTIYLRLRRKKVITVVLDTEHQVRYHHVDPSHAYSESYSTRIAELVHPGEARERALLPGDDHGFLWRLNSYWRFLEAPEGVYVQCEAISLTRDIPTGLGWLVGPFIESIPRESLSFTLQSARSAVSRGEAAKYEEHATWQPM